MAALAALAAPKSAAVATIARKGRIRAGQRRATPRRAARQPIGRHRRARRGIDTGRAAPRRQRRSSHISAASAQRAAHRALGGRWQAGGAQGCRQGRGRSFAWRSTIPRAPRCTCRSARVRSCSAFDAPSACGITLTPWSIGSTRACCAGRGALSGEKLNRR